MFYKNVYLVVVAVVAMLFFSACNKVNLYEKLKSFPNHEWGSRDTASFNITIKDSALYKFYVVVRHTDAYRFNNIWLNITLTDPDSTYSFKREFILADNKQ